ncbi:hypothetical protein SNEBB_005582, partial [Seison nebaliae]
RWMNKFHYIPIHLKDGIIRLHEELNLYHYASTQEFDDLLNSLKNFKFFTEKLNEQRKDNCYKRKGSYPLKSEVSNGKKFQQTNNESKFVSVEKDLNYYPKHNYLVEYGEIKKKTPSEAIIRIFRDHTYMFVRYDNLTIERFDKN